MKEDKSCRSAEYSIYFKLIAYCYELLNYLLLRFRFALQFYYYTDQQILNLINSLRIRRDLLLTIPESLQIYEVAKACNKIRGDFAEVGVYRGGSAKLIAQAKGDRKLLLFDTFAGLPATNKKDKYFKEGEYNASLEYVKKIIGEDPKISYYQGIFPESAKKITNNKYAFVHLDVDLYQSTLDALHYFYPKMSKGGVIISHDYPSSVGVRKAFGEFFKDKPEIILKLLGNQGLIVKA